MPSLIIGLRIKVIKTNGSTCPFGHGSVITLRKKIMKFTKIILLSTIALMANVASAQDYSGMKYDGYNAMQVQNVIQGSVEDMREVTVEATSDTGQYIGAGLGGALGGILGNQVGNNNAVRTAATLIFGAVGAAGGNYAAKAVGREKAFEYIISLDDGRVVSITQSYENANNIITGDRVRIIQGSRVRVVKML